MKTIQHYNDQPIGVFDSGVGGLTVLKALQTLLPNESFIYLGDTARLPYGTKSASTVTRYAQQATHYLVERGIKLLVIACNTAASTALPVLAKDFLEIPVIGVVEPGAEAACQASRNGDILVLATESTVQNRAYELAIHARQPNYKVISQSCSLFVALAEEGWTEGPIAEAVAERYIQPLLIPQQDLSPDCIVLGCTHFPALAQTIKKIAGADISVVDSAHTTSHAVQQLLLEKNLQRQSTQEPTIEFLATDAPERFTRIAARFLQKDIREDEVEFIEITQR